jgi:hypothetical protein
MANVGLSRGEAGVKIRKLFAAAQAVQNAVPNSGFHSGILRFRFLIRDDEDGFNHDCSSGITRRRLRFLCQGPDEKLNSLAQTKVSTPVSLQLISRLAMRLGPVKLTT